MNTAITLLSIIPMRKEPAHRSEMVSQLLCGEYVETMEEEENFIRVRCLYDDYEGWVQTNQLSKAEHSLTTDTYVANWSQSILINGRNIHIPMGSPVYKPENTQIVSIGESQIEYSPTDHQFYWNSSEKKFTKDNLETIYQNYLDSPYLWGGKSVFGIDCSGFVQQVFKMLGIKLLRDAYLQAQQGVLVENLQQGRMGDLAFFNNENGRIVHVGILLENNQIVHASGNVRIDTIDEHGIINKQTGKRTHQLCLIKKIL
jgi:gamma-D-glutamyl-L-lysine dipeptidyl-peptidase